MADNSNELLIGNSIPLPGPGDGPEFNNYSEGLIEQDQYAIYTSTKDALINNLGTEKFKNLWQSLNDDIKFNTHERQRIFSEQILDKIGEVYDFQFPTNISLETEYEMKDFYKFLEFLEYDNIEFISSVWRFVKPVNLMRFDIEKFCNENKQKIIDEIEEQVDAHPQTELITIFSRTYYKDGMINWFIKNTKRSKIDITINIFESEG
jgi:hypothetical protein